MRLSSHDAAFLYGETASGPMHGVALQVMDGAPPFSEIYDFYAQRVHRVPRLRQKLAYVPFNIAHPRWVDDPDFDLSNHVKEHALAPGTTLARAFSEAVELSQDLLPRDRPLWLFYVLTGVPGKTLLLQMNHHAFADGAISVAMMLALTDEAANSSLPEIAPEWSPEPIPSAFELWQEAMAEASKQTMDRMQNSVATMTELQDLQFRAATYMARMMRPVMQAPWNVGLIGPKRKCAFWEIGLNQLKAIKTSLGGSLNDVIVTLVLEAMSRHMSEAGIDLTDQMVRIMCPVNVRDPDADPLDFSSNRVSAMFPVLPVGPMSVLDRYHAVVAETQDIKAQDEPRTLDRLQQLQGDTPPVAMAPTLTVGTPVDPTLPAARAPHPILPNTFDPQAQQLGHNFTVTNVPGPAVARFVAGARIETATGALMLSGNIGFSTVVTSYDDKLFFGLASEPRLFADIEVFRDRIAEVYDELATAVRDQEE